MNDDLVREKLARYVDDVTPAHLPGFALVGPRHRRRRLRQAIAATSSVVVVALVVVFAAVLAQSSPHVSSGARTLQSQLVGPKWTMQSVTNDGVVRSVPQDKAWSVTFTSTTYLGTSSCNALSGPVTFQSSTVTIGASGAQPVACGDADAQSMQVAFEALESGPAEAVINGNTLTLTVGKQVLTLTSQTETLQNRLAGHTWTLTAITAGVNTNSVPVTGGWALTLTPTTYKGTDGCRSVSGTVAYALTSLTLTSTAATTTQACADPQGIERAFDALMKGPVKAALQGDELSLTAPGVGVLTLTSVPTVATPTPDTAGAALESWLTGNSWLVKSITSGGKTWSDPVSSEGPQQPTLNFGTRGYRINLDCNDHLGAVSYAGGRLIMRAVEQTAMGCAAADVLQAKSADVADALFTGPITYVHKGSSLVLSNRQTAITFTAGPKSKVSTPTFPPPSTGTPTTLSPAASLQSQLVGPVWSVRTLIHRGVALTNVLTRTGSVTFTAKGYTADDSCNQDLRGRLSYGPRGFTATHASGVTQACASTQGWSQLIDRLLRGKTDAVLTDDVLTLSAGGDVAMLDSQPQPIPSQTTLSATALQSELIGPRWLLESWTVSGKTSQASAGPQGPWMQFSADAMNASDGCNSGVAQLTYAVSGIRTASPLGSTDVACPRGPSALRSAYTAAFTHTVAVYVYDNGQRLTLSGASGESFNLHRDTGVQLSPFAVSLIGPTWKLQSVKAPGVNWHPVVGSDLHSVLLLTASTFNASNGCESHGGDLSFDASGATLNFGTRDSEGACSLANPGPPAGTFPPDDYFAALVGNVRASLSGRTLTLASGKVVLTFSR